MCLFFIKCSLILRVVSLVRLAQLILIGCNVNDKSVQKPGKTRQREESCNSLLMHKMLFYIKVSLMVQEVKKKENTELARHIQVGSDLKQTHKGNHTGCPQKRSCV